MKKAIGILGVAVILTVCLLLAGCGDKGGEVSPDSQYIGTWQAVKAEFKGDEVDIHEVLTEEFVFTLNQDGTAVVNTEGQEHQAPWTETNSEVRISSDDINLTLKKNEGYLTMSILGVTIYFEKQ